MEESELASLPDERDSRKGWTIESAPELEPRGTLWSKSHNSIRASPARAGATPAAS